MEAGTYQLQVFISLIVILAAAVVALICDFLKGNNEQLRELTLELKVRREEEQKRIQLMTPQLAAAGVPAFAPVVQRSIAATAKHHEETPAKVAQEHASPRPRATPKDRKRTVAPEALAAMERGAQLAGARRAKASKSAEPQSAPEPPPAIGPEVLAPVPTRMVETISMGTGRSRKNWDSLLATARKTYVEAKPAIEVNENLLEAVVAATASSNAAKASEPTLPAGFQDGFVLRQLVQSHRPISGLVVSIGVNTMGESNGTLAEPVNTLVQSLLGPEDFAAQAAADEFLLIFPNERGASAQRRLSQIAQQLWDFQLRSLGSYSILFNWGGVEVRSESIDEAIASANERMMETKRGRKVVSMEHLREAV